MLSNAFNSAAVESFQESGVPELADCTTPQNQQKYFDMQFPSLCKPGYLDERIEVAQGYKIELLTENLDGPRFMRFSPDGFLLVASPKQKSIFLIETEGQNRGAQKIVIQDLNRPHSLDFFENKIYPKSNH